MASDTFLSNSNNLLEQPIASDVPLIIGYTDAEGILIDLLNNALYGSSKAIDLEEFLPKTARNLDENTKKEIFTKIKDFYFDGNEPTINNMDGYIKLISDAWFIYGIQKAAKEYLNKAKSSLYFYRFSMDTKANFVKNLHPKTAAYSGKHVTFYMILRRRHL